MQDPGIIGCTVRMNGVSVTIIGASPPSSVNAKIGSIAGNARFDLAALAPSAKVHNVTVSRLLMKRVFSQFAGAAD